MNYDYRKISEKEALISNQFGKERDFWLKTFSGEWVKSVFPYDFKRKGREAYRMESRRYVFPGELGTKLDELSKGKSHRLHIILAAGVTALIHKYTGSGDIVFGVPIYKQNVKGDFLNTVLAIRNQFVEDTGFKELLLGVRQSITAANENQNYPIDVLSGQLKPSHTGGDSPLFDISVLMDGIHDKADIENINHNVMFLFQRRGRELELQLEYNALLYEKESIETIAGGFLRLMSLAVRDLNVKLPRLDILSPEEKHRLLVDFNDTKRDYPRDKTIHELFEDRVELSPGAVAAVFDGEAAISYRALDQRAGALAGHLSANGVTADVIVGIMCERSLEMLVGILAILKAGGAYLPMDVDFPTERKKFMVSDSNLGIVLVDSDYDDIRDHVPLVFDLRDPGSYAGDVGPVKKNRFNHLAYVIYTSGSTADPKGTLVEHRAVVRLVKNTNFVRLEADHRILQTGALEFDASTFELWGALLNGPQLHLVDIGKILAHETLKGIVRRYRITTMWMTSPLFNQVAEADTGVFDGLKHLLVGGDVLSPFHINKVRNVFPGLDVINGYGPTENTTFSTTHLIKEEYTDRIPIGSPIANSTVYITDGNDNPVPRGAAGEILVGGDGVARGYLNNPELTNSKFQIPNYNAPPENSSLLTPYPPLTSAGTPGRLTPFYRTGDLGRWLADGSVEFLGRMDQQVKIRGYRIEPGEIEGQLLKTGLVSETVVMVREYGTGEKYLCAYFVPRPEVGPGIDIAELRSRLHRHLPEFMVPAFFTVLDVMPLNANGKVDRKALPAPVLNAKAGYVAPRDEIEEKLAAVWMEVLGREEQSGGPAAERRIGIDTDFFELGGHSIKAMSLITKIHKELDVKLPLEEIFENSTIRGLAEYIKGTAKERFAAIEAVEEKEYYPLASAQKRLYVIYLFAPESTAYNMPLAREIAGAPDIDGLKGIFRRLIERHESLRTSFVSIDGEPVQAIHKTVEFDIENEPRDFIRPFDLSRAPLMRVGVEKSGEDRYRLLVDMHHIISDGVSRELLVKEFMTLYSGEELIPSQLHLQYRDFSEWQHREEQRERLKKQESYWMGEFSGELPVLNLPTDYPRPLVKSYEGGQVGFLVGEHETRVLKDIARTADATLFAVILSLHTILLSKLSGREDIIVGFPTAGRRHADLDRIIGMFVNTLPIRSYPTPDKTFTGYLSEVRGRVLAGLENQDYQFEDLVDKLSVPRDTGRNPIFDALVSIQEQAVDPGDLPAEDNNDDGNAVVSAKFDTNLRAVDAGTQLFFSLQYGARLFKRGTIERFTRYFKKIVSAVVENPGINYARLEILSEEERKQLVYEFNDTAGFYPREKTIHQLFEEQAEKSPDRIALVDNGKPMVLTYGELNEKSHRLSNRLRTGGIGRGHIVAVKTGPSVEMIVGIMAVLKSGACYMPVNPENPRARTEYMLADSGAKLLLTDDSPSETGAFAIKTLDLREESLYSGGSRLAVPGPGAAPGDGVYTIYTSGTTGNPKGVLLKHENLVNYCAWFSRETGLTAEDRSILTASFAFDLGYTSIYPCLLNGGQLHILPKESYVDPGNLSDYIGVHGITYMKLTPSFFAVIAAEPGFPGKAARGLRLLVLGGEAIIVDDVEKAFRKIHGIRVMNHYGPTEATIGCVAQFVDREHLDAYKAGPTIGRPITNSAVFILDKYSQLQPVGVPGELCISGTGLARGYLNRPELTAERFSRAAAPSFLTPYYRSGDLARWNADGTIEFLGRIDHQVKIRGFRIELKEIENRLIKHPEVKEAVVIPWKDKGGEAYLCAYIVGNGSTGTSGLNRYLSESLPDYMIPSYFVTIESIPLTPNGKIDRRKLPEPEAGTAGNYIAPRDEIESQLVKIWADVLTREENTVGIEDDFFRLGGHSLKGIVMISRVHKELDVNVPLAALFKSPTIRGLARYIKGTGADKYEALPSAEKRDYYPLSAAQKRIYILQQMALDNTGYNAPFIIHPEQELDVEKTENVFKSLIRRHESLRTSFENIDEKAVQKVHNDVNFSIEYKEVSEPEAEEITAGFIRPFDLTAPPLLRAVLLLNIESAGFHRQVLLVDMHHIITDGVSREVLTDEFRALYSGETPAPLRLQYKDFSQWQNSGAEKEKLRNQEAYWLDEFKGEIPVIDLPMDYSRPVVQGFGGDRVNFEIPAHQVEDLRKIAEKEGVTLFMLFLGLYNVLISKLSGNEDIVIGSPVSGRRHADLERIIGMFVNTLALRNSPRGDRTFRDFLAEVKERTLNAFENQEYPFEELVEKAGVKRDMARNPLFDVAFSMRNTDAVAGDGPLPANGNNRNIVKTSKFDLTLNGASAGGRVVLDFEYSVALFKESTVRRFMDYFHRVVSAAAADPDIPISDIEIIGEKEKHRILYEFNDPGADYTADKTIHRLFEEQAEKTPDSIALAGMESRAKGENTGTGIISITYGGLDRESTGLARVLFEKGVKPGTITAVMAGRSIETVIGLLAVLKAGGAYLPMDPELPEERIQYMLDDSGAAIVLTADHTPGNADFNKEIVYTGKNLPGRTSLTAGPGPVPADSPAYTIYTSGSTGKPKGVLITHRNISPLLHWGYRDFALGTGDRVVQNISYSFDWAVWETFITLTTGAGLYIPSPGIAADTAAMVDFIETRGITVLHITPTQFQYFLNVEGDLKTLEYLFLGAEKLTGNVVRQCKKKLRERCRVFNMYGPTEVAIISAAHDISRGARGDDTPDERLSSVPIGVPSANGHMVILDKYMNWCPGNIAGELYIGGDGVAPGYLNRPELTREKFQVISGSGGFRENYLKAFGKKGNRGDSKLRLYKTGDLSRRLADGTIEFLGRIDHQVKIRGFRIELGEIENRLARMDGIKEAVVSALAGETAEHYLCAYIVSDTRFEVSELRQFLARDLPGYMIPSYFVQLEKFPVNTNGKIDRNALPEPQTRLSDHGEAPRGELESKLVEIWAGVLGLGAETIGAEDDFFHLGGHSLKATILATRIHKELNIKVPLAELFVTPTVRGLAGYIKGAAAEKYEALRHVEEREYYPLSAAQKRLYILQQMALDNTGYNIPFVIPVEQGIDIEKVEENFKRLIHRHESLRTSFQTVAEEPVQQIHKHVEFSIGHKEIQGGGFEQLISGLIRPFDLGRAPLLRVELLVNAESFEKVLFVDMHHIITDGGSQDILRKEFAALYRGEELQPLKLRYRDFSGWQSSEEKRENLEQQETYWLGEFKDDIPVLDLPPDYPRPVVRGFEGDRIAFALEDEKARGLNEMAGLEGVTLYMVLSGIFYVLLSKLSGREDIVIGTPVSGRRHADLEPIIGMFVNTLALRNFPAGHKTFREFLSRVKEKTLDAFENQEYPFEDLVDRAGVNRDTGRNPLFDVMFSMQSLDAAPGGRGPEGPGDIVKTSKFDLTLSAVAMDTGISFFLDYSTNLFKKETAEGFIRYFKKTAEAVIKTPGVPIGLLEILGEDEKKRLLYEFNDTHCDYPVEKTVGLLFEEQAEKTPYRTAVVYKNNYLTYKALNKKAARWAEVLRAKGLGPNGPAALLTDRSLETVTAIFSILKAGGAYLPLDPGFPEERIRYILEDSRSKVLLSRRNPVDGFNGIPAAGVENVLTFDDMDVYPAGQGENLPTETAGPGDPAYVIYTSGTTGTPKGVMVEQRNLTNLVESLKKIVYNRDTVENVSLLSPYIFDASVKQVFPSLLLGHTLVVVPEEIRLEGDALARYYKEKDIQISDGTPTHLKILLNYSDELAHGFPVRHFVIGGEELDPGTVEQLMDTLGRDSGLKVSNVYGPTECCDVSTVFTVTGENLAGFRRIPIGKPISNVNIYILGRNGGLQLIGAAGELCIAGNGVGRGYLNRPELTAQHFSRGPAPSFLTPYPLPLNPYYRTGDLARWLPDGNIQFLGRIDQQVKIRGYRIEPGEIENRLLGHPMVSGAAVTVREDKSGEKYLCAYITGVTGGGGNGVIDAPALKEYLSGVLPAYMIPPYIVELETIPLTPGGKIDRKALPEPETGTGDNYIAPRDGIESKLAAIWSELLNIEAGSIGIDDNFFHLGGHSLKATIMAARVQKELNVKVPLAELFKAPAIRGFAAYIKGAAVETYEAIRPVEEKEYYPLSAAQKRLYILQQMLLDNTGYNIPFVIPADREIELEKTEDVFKQLIHRHESLRTSFQTVDEEPVQKVHKHVDFSIGFKEIPGNEFGEFLSNFIRPFDLGRAPLLRVDLLLNAETGQRFLFVDMHHIITDGGSQDILRKEFAALYRGEEIPAVKLRYKDFAGWRNSGEKRENPRRQESYWLEEFEGGPPVLDLPLDYPRPAVQTFEGNRVEFALDGEMARGLNKIAGLEGVTLYMVLLGIYNVLLSKLSGREDVVIGTPVSGRGHADLETVIGMFVNTLALRNFPAGHKTFREFLSEVKVNTLGAFENQEYPFEDLVDRVGVNRDTGRNPLFDVMFSMQTIDGVPGERGTGGPGNIVKTSKFDLTLHGLALDKGLSFSFEYSVNLFKEDTVRRFINYFIRIVSAAAADPDITISDIEITTVKEKHRILYEFNNTETAYPQHKTIHQLFEEQAERTPDNIALTGPSVGASSSRPLQLSYRRLNEKSNRTARLLIQKGSGPNVVTGIMVGRSVETIIGILGILKSGGAYLPIDPAYPPERKRYMLTDNASKLVITDGAGEIPGIENENCESVNITNNDLFRGDGDDIKNPCVHHGPDDLIYTIFTSGSTGVPKGAGVYHRGFMNLMNWYINEFHLDGGDGTLLLTSTSFDLTQKNIYAPLSVGGRLHIPVLDYFDPEIVLREIRKNKLTWINCTPSMFYRLVEDSEHHRKLSSLKYVFLGGEPISVKMLEEWYESGECFAEVVNTYGPTECTDVCAYYPVKEWEKYKSGSVPIGKPVSNTGLYVLNRERRLVPPGVFGELCISGGGVGGGYINHAEKTQEHFITVSFEPGKSTLVYRTGDLARQLPDGNIEFSGRIDHQVKIRGYRIEVGEIENRLLEHPNVKEAVVLPKGTDAEGKYLCAYITSADGEPGRDPGELREYLSQSLPDYMIPAFFLELDEIPVNANGKVDRKALPEPGTGSTAASVPPRDEIESKLAAIWSALLNLEAGSIGIDDNFFHLGGHSLKATILAARIQKELNVKVPLAELFKTPAIRGLAAYIKGAAAENYEALPPVEEKEYYPLSAAQKRLYILQQMLLDNTGYNIPFVIPVDREIDAEKTEDVFKQLIHRHESLRTSFETVNEEPVQKIHKHVDFSIGFKEIPGNEFEKFLSNFIRPFDLDRAPLLRAGLLLNAETGQQFLFVDMHHIITDGGSQDILRKEFAALYLGEEIPPLKLRYKDFSGWGNREEKGQNLERRESYWLEEFKGEIPVLDLPLDYPRPAVQTFEGNRVEFALDGEMARGLNKIAGLEGVTLYMVLLGIYNVLLSKLSGREDIVIGTPVSGRGHADLETVIGMFVNTLALRNFPAGHKTFREFLSEVKVKTLGAFENQEYPFEDLVDRVGVNRDTGRNPLFDVMFSMQTIDGVPGDPRQGGPGNIVKTSKFDLTLHGLAVNKGISFSFEYSVNLFKEDTVRRFINYFIRIVSAAAADPGITISDIEITGEKEKHRIMYEFNNPGVNYTVDKTIHQLFEDQVEKTPANIALISADARLSYGRLNRDARRVAGLLRRKGLLPGTVAAVKIHRSIEMVAGILGILKAGLAYLPILPEYPEEREKYILADSGAGILFTTDLVNTALRSLDTDPPAAPAVPSQPHAPAYVIYTSGSTGKPKGVLVEHKSVVNLLETQQKEYPFGESDTYLLKTSYAFDVSVSELFGWYTGGGRLALLETGGEKDPGVILDTIERNRVTHINFVPSMFNAFTRYITPGNKKQLTRLRYIFLAGEALSAGLVRKFRDLETGVRLENLYGPTEGTVYASGYSLSQWDGSGNIPIGKPLQNVTLHITDETNRLQPIGLPGELCISGAGVARGYLNRPELTAERFSRGATPSLLTPFYRTGDRARWLPDGTIEYLGRIDHQVKIRGYRIEPGEIENRLSGYPKIKEAVVTVHEDGLGDKSLVAYYVSGEALSQDELVDYLGNALPDYMIPAYFMPLQTIPLTTSGKVDRKALPEPEAAAMDNYTAPRNGIESKLAVIWSELLNIEAGSIGIDDNFFRLGGHSLKATIMASKVRKEFNVSIPLGEIFKTPVIRGLADYLAAYPAVHIKENSDTGRTESDDDAMVLIRRFNQSIGNLFLIHDGSGEIDGYTEFCRGLNLEFNCWGIRAGRLEGYGPLNLDIEDIASRYIQKIKQIQPTGPLYIFGWSLGGTIAFEMVRQLEVSGREVGFLGVVDSPPPNKKSGKHLSKFSAELESGLLEKLLPENEIITKTLKKQKDTGSIWREAVDYLENTPAGKDIVAELAARSGADRVLDFSTFHIKDAITHINRYRTLYNSRGRYIPTGKIDTPLHFFKAGLSGDSIRNGWDKYVSRPVNEYEISGNHYSLFKKPAVERLLKMVEEAFGSEI